MNTYNLLRSKLYVCPVCGNILHASGAATISCCGVTLPSLEAEKANEGHSLCVERMEDELFLSVQHPMTKEHYISFLAYCTDDRFLLRKLYPEGNAEARFFSRGSGTLYWYCNQHGLFYQKI